MNKVLKIASMLWSKFVQLPGLTNLLIGLGIYALEQLVVYLRAQPKPEYSYSPNNYILVGE